MTRFVAFTALMTAAVYVGSLLGFSSPQFYFNFGDSIILLCAALLNPASAMIAGGLGAFLCDLTVYPATMLFTLVIKAIEGAVAGILYKLLFLKPHNKYVNIALSLVINVVSSGLMMTGYFVAQTFMYGTYAAAIVALPMDAVQAAVSSVIATLVLFVFGLARLRQQLSLKKYKTDDEESNKT